MLTTFDKRTMKKQATTLASTQTLPSIFLSLCILSFDVQIETQLLAYPIRT